MNLRKKHIHPIDIPNGINREFILRIFMQHDKPEVWLREDMDYDIVTSIKECMQSVTERKDQYIQQKIYVI